MFGKEVMYYDDQMHFGTVRIVGFSLMLRLFYLLDTMSVVRNMALGYMKVY